MCVCSRKAAKNISLSYGYVNKYSRSFYRHLIRSYYMKHPKVYLFNFNLLFGVLKCGTFLEHHNRKLIFCSFCWSLRGKILKVNIIKIFLCKCPVSLFSGIFSNVKLGLFCGLVRQNILRCGLLSDGH